MSKLKKFIIVDGNAILHRAWHAIPPMLTKDGQQTNAAYGFISTFFKAMKEFNPEFVAVCFDRKEKTFRHEEFKEYKAQREKQPDELYAQIPMVKEVLEAMNVKIFEKAGFEADDVIGTLCDKRQVNRDDVLSIIVTGDMDTLQLVDANTEVFTLRKGMSDTVVYNEKAVQEKFEGLVPAQMIDYKGLRGDPSDNIPGVPGIGEKTALGLMKEFGSIENLYKKIEPREYKNIKVTERIYNLLKDNKDKALQGKMLSTIVRDVPLEFDLDECSLKPYDKTKVFEVFQTLEFKSLLNRLPYFENAGASPESGVKSQKSEGAEEKRARVDAEIEKKHTDNGHEYIHVKDEKEFERILDELKKQKEFVFDTETDNLNVFRAKLLGISFCWEKGKAVYVEAQAKFLEKLKPILEDDKIKKIGHNLKFDVKILRLAGIEVKNLYFDTMIASYLLNPGTRAHKLDDLVFRELGYQMTKITDLIGKKGQGQITLGLVDNKKVSDYSCEDADYTWRLVEILEKKLQEDKLWDLFVNIEMPLVEVLVEMELNGIKIDVDFLNKMGKNVGDRIKALEKSIHEMAKVDFNIASPKQLKEVLFEKLKLSVEGIGKTKTGLSTAADELEKLRGLHPIIELLEEYRELTKLLSTYIEALPAIVEADGRVHTEFNQTITATGRLSSSNPNLQNIPIRTELGQEIRKAFIAEPGNQLISADYSQVELRVIACLAKDKNMMAVFERGEDIHKVTAAKIYGVPLEKVTKEMRSAAKEVNFGVLYGMGAWGLAARKKISREQAREFIEKYFENFKDVKKYIDQMKDDARRDGFVQTLFGRRRYLPEINSGVQQVRAGAERMAINMPIQGTAADLMKIAMIEVVGGLKVQSPKSKVLLQVHDELVIEVPKDEVAAVAKVVDEKMEKIHKLCVPIKVDTEAGENWGEMDMVG